MAARIAYLSRTAGVHDRRWVATLTRAGHDVTALTLDDAAGGLGDRELDLVVAGPLSDAVPAAVDADVAPVLAVCWAFDLLVEAEQDDAVRRRIADALPRCTGVHVDCEAMRGAVIHLGADPARVSLAAWGIDVDRFTPGPATPALRQRAGLAEDHVVVLSTRAWEAIYDIDVVLHGFALAQREDPRLRLVLAGAGSRADEVRSTVDRLGLTESCVLPGRLAPEEVLDWLRSSDVYVAAARSDGSSLSLMEALACGVPVVVPACGGNPEWVAEPAVGQLFPVGSDEGLASGILEVLEGPAAHGEAVHVRRSAVLAKGCWADNQATFLRAVERCLEEAR